MLLFVAHLQANADENGRQAEGEVVQNSVEDEAKNLIDSWPEEIQKDKDAVIDRALSIGGSLALAILVDVWNNTDIVFENIGLLTLISLAMFKVISVGGLDLREYAAQHENSEIRLSVAHVLKFDFEFGEETGEARLAILRKLAQDEEARVREMVVEAAGSIRGEKEDISISVLRSMLQNEMNPSVKKDIILEISKWEDRNTPEV